MGALIAKQKDRDGSDASASGAGGGGGNMSAYAPGLVGIGPDGVLKDPVVEGILNLENRQITVEIFAKISTILPVTKQVGQ